MKQLPSLVLAIESAVAGGSLSLLRDGVEIANWIGSDNISKAEDLLFNIDAMLTEQNLSRHDINLIAVSAGPGSFTGIRIGIATAMGLKTGLGIELVTVPVLKVMVGSAHNLTAAVPAGRNAVCFQSFTGGDRLEPVCVSEDEFFENINANQNMNFLLHSSLYTKAYGAQNTRDFGVGLAKSIGIVSVQYIDEPRVEPIFISKTF